MFANIGSGNTKSNTEVEFHVEAETNIPQPLDIVRVKVGGKINKKF